MGSELFDVHKVRPDGSTTFYSGDLTEDEARTLVVKLEAKGFAGKIVPAVPVPVEEPEDDRPRCPTCGATDLSRFPLGKKVGKAALLGPLGLRNVTKQFRCENCGYRW